MINIKRFLSLLVGVLLLYACDTPKKPNFIASHKIEAPVLLNKDYPFLGGEGALLDTTKSDYDSLFVVKGDDHVIISTEENLESVFLFANVSDYMVLDLFNEEEVHKTELPGLETLSKQLDGIEFTNPSLTLSYETDAEVVTTIYGVILGTNSNNNSIYLSGADRDGTLEVAPNDPITGLNANGIQVPADKMIKFEIESAQPGETKTGSITFDKNNSNADKFLNNLPSEIRFIGKAVDNQNNGTGTFSKPFIFDSKINFDIPLTLTSSAAAFRDTVDQDLSNFPSKEKGDDSQITHGQIEVVYTNGIPMGMDIQLNFLDEFNELVTAIPVANDNPIQLTPSEIDPITSFSSTPTTDKMVISLNAEQLLKLYKTKSMEINGKLITTSVGGVNQPVKLRAKDKIKLGIRANITIETTVN